MRTAHFTAIYNAPLVIWVEDEITAEYLATLWQDAHFRFLVAGNVDAVSGLVNTARSDGLQHVFGVGDRDFRQGNVARWSDADGPVILIPSVHEIENYFLSAQALAGFALNTATRTVQQIETKLSAIVGGMTWWMAACDVISQLWELAMVPFIEQPRRANVTSESAARQCIIGSPWYSSLSTRIAALMPDAQIDALLSTAHDRMSAALADGSWVTTFCGKEIFKQIHPFVYPYREPQATRTERANDIAQQLAAWQIAHNAVPPEVSKLRTAILTRLGIP